MAVVQISKIQIRRDIKDASPTSPLPVQLAAGELAWCIDTRQLYIGSYEQSAPENKLNVEILTKYSDIFSIGEYSYKRDIITTGSGGPIYRPVQDRLDDRVNAASFGVLGGNDSDSEAINRAIEKLYKDSLNGRKDIRAVLEFSPGQYIIKDPIYLYSYTKIIGAGPGRTVFKYEPNDPEQPAFIFLDDEDNPSEVDLNTQCKFVSLRDFTLDISSPQTTALDLFCVRNSEFSNLELKGTWNRNYTGNTSIGISFRVRTDQITCKDNDFNNINITGFKYGINAKGDAISNTIRNSIFSFNEIGVNFGYDPDSAAGTLNIALNIPGEKFGPRNNSITTCAFKDITKHAVKVWQGQGNIVSKNTMSFVGNNGGGNIEAAFGQIEIDVPNNYSFGNYSDRHKDLAKLGTDSLSVVPYVPEVTGKTYYENRFNNTLTLRYLDGNPEQNLFRFPLPSSTTAGVGPDNCSIEVDYLYRSDNNTNRRLRKGTLTVLLDVRTTTLPKVNLTDEYDYLGLGLDTDISNEDNTFRFKATLEQQNNKWQVIISYKYNTDLALTATTEKGQITYTYKILS